MRLRGLIALTGSVFALQGCFFIWIPGSVVSAVGDALTGSDGEHCVSASAKVGDTIKASNGQRWVVKSTSGESSRCKNLEHPIRARLITYEEWQNSGGASAPLPAPAPAPAPQAASQAASQQLVAPSLQASQTKPGVPVAFVSGLSLTTPEGWEKRSLTESMIAGRGVVYSVNRTIDGGLLLSSVERKGITDLHEFAKSRRANQSDRLGEAQWSEIMQLQINGRTAFRFEVVGTLKTGAKMKYMMTIIEGKEEIALLNTWASPTNLDQNRGSFEQLASMVTGL